MGRVVPEIVSANRNEAGRKKIARRYHERFKKSQTIAYTLWFILCVFGAHRFYLKHWGVGIGIIAVLGLSIIVGMIDHELGAIVQLFLALVFAIEGCLLFKNVKKYNAELLKQINGEVGLN